MSWPWAVVVLPWRIKLYESTFDVCRLVYFEVFFWLVDFFLLSGLVGRATGRRLAREVSCCAAAPRAVFWGMPIGAGPGGAWFFRLQIRIYWF